MQISLVIGTWSSYLNPFHQNLGFPARATDGLSWHKAKERHVNDLFTVLIQGIYFCILGIPFRILLSSLALGRRGQNGGEYI